MGDDPQHLEDRRTSTRRSTMPNKTSTAVILQMVSQNDEKHEQGHQRLRTDWRELDERVEHLETVSAQHENRLVAITSTPQDISKLSMSPGLVASIVLAVVGIVGTNLATTWGMRSDISSINLRLESRSELDKSTQKIQDERASALQKVVDEIKRKQDLQQLEVQSLRETILNQRRTR